MKGTGGKGASSVSAKLAQVLFSVNILQNSSKFILLQSDARGLTVF